MQKKRETDIPAETKPLIPMSEFQVPEIVKIKVAQDQFGPVMKVILGAPNRYDVFINGQIKSFFADQIEAITPHNESATLTLEQFRARLTALYLQHPGISTLYSLQSARVDYIPYQFRPVIKFIRSDRPRLLIADEVGVGKTIEAGLILRELQARNNLSSVLVLCPKALVTDRKWERDLGRFDEKFTQLDSKILRHCINETDLGGEWPTQHSKTIVPFSLFDADLLDGADKKGRHIIGLTELDPPPRFDLLIVDEAHHLRNPNTYAHQAVAYFAAHANAVIFLSATPVQLGSNDLFVLLNLLRPDVVIDKPTFVRMSEPNSHINRAVRICRKSEENWQETTLESLQLAGGTSWGEQTLANNPEFENICEQLATTTIDGPGRVELVHRLENLHSFSRFINRTRRRDIGIFTTRVAQTVKRDFTPEQQRLHDDLMQVQSDLLNRIHGQVNLKFMMTTIRRQAASCLHALAPFLRDLLSGRLELIDGEVDDESGDPNDTRTTEALRESIEWVALQAEELPPLDPKLEALLKIIRDKDAMPNNKLLLFATFRHTLKYLFDTLKEAKIRVGLMDGKTPDEDRIDLRKRFGLPKEDSEAIDVLLCSEIGCEGLDYQFCDCLVNYDLPWNPMRVEQRIGRIDRYGQKSESVAIYNLITPGTVDADIFDRCLDRIGVFQNAIGGNEEILGEITSEIKNVAENLSLTTEQRRARLQQLTDNQIRVLQEEAAMEDKQMELFGIRPPGKDTEESEQASANFWVNPSALQNLVVRYLESTCGTSGDYLLGKDSLKTLRLGEEYRKQLLADFQKLPKTDSLSGREWREWLRGGNPILNITFEAATARDNPKAVFITPVHPLAQQAAQSLGAPPAFSSAFETQLPDLSPGSYPFAIYQWTRKGVREDVVFQPVCAEPALTRSFANAIEKARPTNVENITLPSESTFDALESLHQALFTIERAAHREREQALATFQLASLHASHQASTANIQQMIADASNDKIRTMRESQLRNVETDFRRRSEELTEAANKADILTQQVGRGVIINRR